MEYSYQLILKRSDGLETSISISSCGFFKDGRMVNIVRKDNAQALETEDNIEVSLYTGFISQEHQKMIIPKKEYFNFIETMLALNIELYNNEEKRKEFKEKEN